jgi:hypothetical protein
VARRLEIELTSTREDGTWTWRAAGAKQPRGELDGSILPEGTKVGDIVKVEADASLDGLEITTVFAPKPERDGPELLEMIGSRDEAPLVTSQLAPGRRRDDRRDRGERGHRGDGRGRGERRERGRRGDRAERDRTERDRGRRRGERRDRVGGESSERAGRGDRSRESRRPKAKRLKAGRVHRKAALEALPEEQRALADEVLRGGVPGLRQAIERMNEKAAAEGMPKIKGEPLVALAERLAPDLKAAEWRDRADAALAGLTDIDLRDIRSVVVAADTGARDEAGRELAEQLRTGLAERVEIEHRKWLDELAKTIAEGRTVRALRLSSRPPKAGSPLPPDMAERLASAASAGLDRDTGQERWETVLDAVAYSPVRAKVVPAGLPAEPSAQLLGVVRKLASRIPQIASEFGIEAPVPRRSRGRRPAPPPPPPPVGSDADAGGSGPPPVGSDSDAGGSGPRPVGSDSDAGDSPATPRIQGGSSGV